MTDTLAEPPPIDPSYLVQAATAPAQNIYAQFGDPPGAAALVSSRDQGAPTSGAFSSNIYAQFGDPSQQQAPAQDALGGYLLPSQAQPTAAPPASGLDQFGRSVVQGLLFGGSDELRAATDAASHAVTGFGNDAPTYGERYNANLARERAELAEIPSAIAIPGQLIGGAAAVASGAPAAVGRGVLGAARLIPGANALADIGAAALAPAANVLSRIPGVSYVAPLAAEGAAYGGLQGAADGEGGVESRLKSAGVGAATGAVLAPAVSAAGGVIGKGYNAVSRTLSEAGYAPKNALADIGGAPIAGSTGAPVTATAGQVRAAGQQLVDAATNPENALASLGQARELVPGSAPTTFQVTGDTGLGQKELALRNTPGASQAFIDRGNQQNTARVGAIDASVPETASSADTVNALQAQQAALQARRDAAVAQARAGTLQGVGGATDSVPTQAGADLRGSIDQARAPALDAADNWVASGHQSAQGALDTIGGVVPPGDTGTAQQGYGSDFRGTLSANDQAAKLAVSRLNAAIDPDGKLNVDMTPIRDVATSISDNMPVNAAPLEGAEKGIFDTALNLPDVQPYRELSALNTRVTTAMQTARSGPAADPAAYARLVQLKGGIEAAMNKVVNSPDVTLEQLAPRAAASEAGPVPTTGTTAYTPSGTPVDVRYAVREADTLTPSQLPDGSPHPDFPPELQPRDRTRVASTQQVNQIANNLTPERLGASTSTAEGAPIVGPDGVVESGNGRTLAIQQAYANGSPQADAYRAWLGQQGYDVDGMQAPVLVRERTTPMDMPARAAFAADAGASPVMAASAAERAAADARKLPDDLLASYRGGDVADPENRDFVRSFVRTVAPTDQASFATADGSLSREGAQRIRAALVHRAYGDGGVTAALSETIDPQAKVLAGAMQDAAGPMARLQAGIKAGEVDPAVDLAPSLVEATRLVQQARMRGISLADAVAQRDAFSQVSPQAEAVLRAAYGENLTGRMSQAKMGDLLAAYAGEAEQQSTSGNLFGANQTADQLLQGVSARYGKDAGQAADAASYAGRIRPSNGGDGDQAFRPVDGAAGQAAPAGSRGRAFGGPGVLPETRPQLTANFDAEAAQRARAMRAAHAERKDTYGPRAPGVGQILAPGPTKDTFKLPASSVPQQIFSRGAGAAERVQAAVKAGLSPSQIADYAAFDLRRAAQNPDGTLDPARAAKWRQQNAEAFQALTQANPAIGRSFDTAQQQAQRLADLQAQRSALDATHPLKPGWGDAEVMQRVWQPGPKGADSVRAATSAANGSPVASSSIADYAAYSLRKMAAPDGVLDPKKYATWAKAYDGALSVRPDIKSQFDTAAKAQEMLDATAEQHAQAVKDFQASAAKHFLGGADPARTVGSILRSATAQRDMADLARMTEGDPDARAGIQRAIVDHVFESLKDNNAVPGRGVGDTKLKSDQFQTFINRAVPALRQVMTPEQVDTLHKVAADLQRSNMSVQATRVPGGSDSTQKIGLVAKGAGDSLLDSLKSNVLTGALTLAGWLKGGPVGAAVANRVGAGVNWLRAAGIQKTDDLVKEAMLNPALARVLMAKVTEANRSTVGAALLRTLSGLAAQRGGHAAVVVQHALQPPDQGPMNAMAMLGRGFGGTASNALAAIGR